MQYKRVLLKLSGESLMGKEKYGISSLSLKEYVEEINSLVINGVETAIVIGGGNIFRGVQGEGVGVDRVQGDYMGMLATVINGMALQSALESAGINVVLLSGLAIDPICEKMSGQKADKLLSNGNVVIIAGGSGNPFFTTDTAAALRAVEIKADILLKGTRVDGVYNADPEKCKDAVKYEKITFNEAYEKELNVMDLTAFTLCKENNMPVMVFNINAKGSLEKIINGENIGTIISNKK